MQIDEIEIQNTDKIVVEQIRCLSIEAISHMICEVQSKR